MYTPGLFLCILCGQWLLNTGTAEEAKGTRKEPQRTTKLTYNRIFYICFAMNQRNLLIISGISGALCVALGAMGAHALKDKISAENLQTFETAVRYHFYHTLALMLVILISEKILSKFLNYSSALFITGIILFSFSLYFLALRPVMGIGNEEMKWIGAITPFGGLSFIMAWLMLTFAAFKSNK